MESVECKLVTASGSGWPFDPLSLQTELVLLPGRNQKAIIDDPSNNQQGLSAATATPILRNKLLGFSTLNLNQSNLSISGLGDLNLTLQPDPSEEVGISIVEDLNNNQQQSRIDRNNSNSIAFLQLNPIPDFSSSSSCGQDHSQNHSSTMQTLTNCFSSGDGEDGQDGGEIDYGGENDQKGNGVMEDVDNIYFSILANSDKYISDLMSTDEGNLMRDSLITPFTDTDLPNHSSTLETINTAELEKFSEKFSEFSEESISDEQENQMPASTSTENDFEFEDNSPLVEEDSPETFTEDIQAPDANLGKVPEIDGEKSELKCRFCGFVCCSKSSLGIHERRHTGERPYACSYCGRLFNSAQCCKHHERLHTGDKPFECQYCGKKYAVSTRLKRHERVHTREEPYKCGEPGCGKTFRWFDAFRDHRNTHNGVPLYLCSVCGKSFTSYLKFYYHERGHFLKRERDRAKKGKEASSGDPSNAKAKKSKKTKVEK